MENRVVNIVELGKEIGMQEKEQTLPNGKIVKGLVWDPKKLEKAVDAIKHLSSKGEPVLFDGPAPAWLLTSLSHAVHPCKTMTYVLQIRENVDIVVASKSKEIDDNSKVKFKTTETGKSILIEFELADAVYNVEDLNKLVVPEISNGKAVYISGRGPNYLSASIAETYAHTGSSVSLFQPGIGYTCAITHSLDKKLGELDKDPLKKEEILKEVQDKTKKKFVQVKATEKKINDNEIM